MVRGRRLNDEKKSGGSWVPLVVTGAGGSGGAAGADGSDGRRGCSEEDGERTPPPVPCAAVGHQM